MGYEIRIKEGHGFSLENCKLLDTWTGDVVFVEADGKETHAIAVQSYFKTDRNKQRIRTKLNEQRRRLEYHYKSTGKRWELERKAEADAKRAADKAAKEVRLRLRDAAPELYAACVELIRGADKPGDHLQRVIDLARAAIDKAENGEPVKATA